MLMIKAPLFGLLMFKQPRVRGFRGLGFLGFRGLGVWGLGVWGLGFIASAGEGFFGFWLGSGLKEEGRGLTFEIWEFPKITGTFFGGPYSKDPTF